MYVEDKILCKYMCKLSIKNSQVASSRVKFTLLFYF